LRKAAEDNFHIEVWDRAETALGKTINRPSDSSVSQAAWQATIRRRPRMLLIHYGRLVMKKISPGEVKILPLPVWTSPLREWHTLRASCIGARIMLRLSLQD
jgi:hypothetical protein